MFCPICDGFLLWSSLKALASPLQGLFITVKCFLPHRRPLLPALLWIWLLRNGCRDCKSRHMVALPWQTKKGWKRKNRWYGFEKFNWFLVFLFSFKITTWSDHECSSALPLNERLRMWFLNCSISSGFCCWICCANCCPLSKSVTVLFTYWIAFYQEGSLPSFLCIYNPITGLPLRGAIISECGTAEILKSQRRFLHWLLWQINETQRFVVWKK